MLNLLRRRCDIKALYVYLSSIGSIDWIDYWQFKSTAGLKPEVCLKFIADFGLITHFLHTCYTI